MPNTWFQFKEFKIEQEKCDMKVCTDSCVFGVWIANKIEKKVIEPATILDIGSGTGLLTLMIAQKSSAQIDAVEINGEAFFQNSENFKASKYSGRLQAFNADVKDWNNHKKYDLIISNPPFFENDLQSNNQNKNISKHDDGLTLKSLLHSIKSLLKTDGCFSVLLPFHRLSYFKDLVDENGFYLKEELLVRQTPKHSHFRGILFCGTKKEHVISNELAIKDEFGNYTEAFSLLLRDYYL